MPFALIIILNGKRVILSLHPTYADADRARAYSPFSDAKVVNRFKA